MDTSKATRSAATVLMVAVLVGLAGSAAGQDRNFESCLDEH